MDIDQTRRRKRSGPIPKKQEDLRTHSVHVRMTTAELAELDLKRGHIQRGTWLRQSAMHRIPPTIPAINRDAWAALATAVANLNQYQAAINKRMAHEIPTSVLDALRDQVQALRLDLIGARWDEGVDDEGDA